MGGASGKKLDEIYKLAWVRGLKTTYYLRTMAATHVEKSTVAHGALNAVSSGGGEGTGGVGGGAAGGFGASGGAGGALGNGGGLQAAAAAAPAVAVEAAPEADGPVCMMRPGDPGFDECEACQ
jgi:ribonucleoside-diphosphate reductase alpha chain